MKLNFVETTKQAFDALQAKFPGKDLNAPATPLEILDRFRRDQSRMNWQAFAIICANGDTLNKELDDAGILAGLEQSPALGFCGFYIAAPWLRFSRVPFVSSGMPRKFFDERADFLERTGFAAVRTFVQAVAVLKSSTVN